jgi:hypothetical protein
MASPTQYSYYIPFEQSDSEDSDNSDSSDDTHSSHSSDSRHSSHSTDESQKSEIQIPDYTAFAKSLAAPLTQRQTQSEEGFQALATYRSDANFNDKKEPVETLQIARNTTAGYPVDYETSSGNTIKTESQTITHVIDIRSVDRDRKSFPQPTNCRLFLPQRYKNVTNLTISQINFLSVFPYFLSTKQNISIQIYEDSRILYKATIPTLPDLDTSNPKPLLLTNTIREGSYNITSLLDELSLQLNKTPLFFDFVNGYDDFKEKFLSSGDLSINFNDPGDTFYNSLSKTFLTNPTRESITQSFFSARFFNTDVTDLQILVAYYYPVLKELASDPETVYTKNTFTWNSLQVDISYPNMADPKNYILYKFEGITDPVIQDILKNPSNFSPLDTYRLYHTFRYSLINKYDCSVNFTNSLITIKSSGLNTSLVNHLTSTYNTILKKQISYNGLTDTAYANLAANVNKYNSIIQEMYTFLQNNFTKYFGIDNGTFSSTYFTHLNNTLFIKSAIDADTVKTRDRLSIPISEDIMTRLNTPSPAFWPYLTNISNTQGPPINMGLTSESYPNSSNFPYSLSASNIDLSRHFIDSNGYIYTDFRRNAGDILVDVEAGKYTIFKFRSKYRQSIQVETLPRQTQFRYPIWNKANPLNYPLKQLFDLSYCYVAPDPTTKMGSNILYHDIKFNPIYGWSNAFNVPPNKFATGYDSSLSFWQENPPEFIDSENSYGKMYSVTAPYVNNTKDSNIYKYEFNITIQASETFPTNLLGFLYHDIAALAADVSINGRLKESPYHYKQTLPFQQNSASNTFTFQAYAGQTYYILFRPAILSPPRTSYKVIPWFTSSNYTQLVDDDNINPALDPFTQISNYSMAIQADPDFIRLPIRPSTLWESNSPFNIMSTFKTFGLSNNITPIGYDINGISDDLTDYIPNSFQDSNSSTSLSSTRIDPLTDYIFQFNTPYDSALKKYDFSLKTNSLFTKNGVNLYTPEKVLVRQYKIAHYYNTAYIRDSGNISYSMQSINSDIPPYSINTTNGEALGGYTYSTGLVPNLQLGDGVCGYMFLPGDGIWAIDRITFKTNFINPNDRGNLNSRIHILGVFLTSDIASIPITEITLSNAVSILVRVSEKTYTPTTQNSKFDSAYGTYYTFSNYPSLVQNKASISGFTQTAGSLITDVSSYYSFLGFTLSDFLTSDGRSKWSYTNININLSNIADSNITVASIQNLYGSPIPYPYTYSSITSYTFYDGSFAPTGADMVIASNSPSAAFDYTISKYERSIPFVNSHLLYKSPQNIIANSNGFMPWSSLPVVPEYVHASVYNTTTFSDNNSIWTTGDMLFQKEAFTVVSYKIVKSVNNYTEAQRDFITKDMLSIQNIYPDNERTSLVAVSGNDSNFVFVGVRSTDLQMRFKVYDPTNGVLTELPTNSNYIFNKDHFIQNFVYNNSNGWFYSAYNTNTSNINLVGTPSYSLTQDSNFISKSYTGKKSVLQMPPGGQNLYFAPYILNGFSNLFISPLDPTNVKSMFNPFNETNGYFINLNTTPVGANPYYTHIVAVLNARKEEILLMNTINDFRRYYKIRNFIYIDGNTSNTNIDPSIQTLKDLSGNFIKMHSMIGGGLGSKWLLSESYPYVYGNRNDAYDSSLALGIAWQIFFPTVKIEMRKLLSSTSPILDLRGVTYPEWPHTCMFAYSNYDTMMLDISTKWGIERNSMVSDISFNGFYYNSYCINIPVQDTSSQPISDSNAYTYLAVRGYLPTEQFQSMMRFYLPNRYDFGYLRIKDIIDEIPLTQSLPYKFNPDYSDTLLQFNSNFIFNERFFGANRDIIGSNITSTGFSNFMSQYITTYSNFSTGAYKLNIIQSTLFSEMKTYISSNFSYIIPSNYIERNKFTDPILFQILWKDNLKPPYDVADDTWGLGWNLGFLKSNTELSLIHTGTNLFNIQPDYIFLKLNDELNLNRLDTGSQENYAEGRNPTGSTNKYYGKLLLTSFGGNATTFIQNPVSFNPPLTSLSQLQFQWLDAKGFVIDNSQCDWNMTINVSVKKQIASISEKKQNAVD